MFVYTQNYQINGPNKKLSDAFKIHFPIPHIAL